MAISIIDTVKEAYSRFFDNRTLLIIGLVGAFVSSIMSFVLIPMFAPFAGTQINPSAYVTLFMSPMFWIEMIGTVIVFGLIALFISGAVVSAATEGNKATLGSAARKTASRYVSLIGTCFGAAALSCLSVIPAVAVFILIVLLDGAGALVQVALGVIGAALVLIPIYVSLRLSLAEVSWT